MKEAFFFHPFSLKGRILFFAFLLCVRPLAEFCFRQTQAGRISKTERNRKGGGAVEEFLRVGVITSTHGIKGEVKVYPTTDDAERFLALKEKEVLLDTGREMLPLVIENVRFFKNLVILKFQGIDNINDIEKYRGRDLLVTRENAVPLEEGEFFICDIIGSTVYEEDGSVFGTLRDVMETGANNVFVVETGDGREVLLPYIDDCIREVNVEEKRIVAYIMPGLTD